jgi:hypothetical protein
MRRRKTTIAAILMAAAGACLNAQGRLTVAVFDYAGVPGAAMSPAVEMARRTFAGVGIETVWVVCRFGQAWPEGCSQTLPPVERRVSMNVMPEMGTKEAHLAGTALTGPDTPYRPLAYASYAAVENLGETTGRPVWLALGCVMTHEIAHLLGLPHRERGVMRAALGWRQMDEARLGLGFTEAEEKQLREGARRLTAALEVAEAGRSGVN